MEVNVSEIYTDLYFLSIYSIPFAIFAIHIIFIQKTSSVFLEGETYGTCTSADVIRTMHN